MSDWWHDGATWWYGQLERLGVNGTTLRQVNHGWMTMLGHQHRDGAQAEKVGRGRLRLVGSLQVQKFQFQFQNQFQPGRQGGGPRGIWQNQEKNL